MTDSLSEHIAWADKMGAFDKAREKWKDQLDKAFIIGTLNLNNPICLSTNPGPEKIWKQNNPGIVWPHKESK